MFKGYHFFDYKYDIAGYNGQDYDGFGRYLYMILAIALLVILLVTFREIKKESITKYLKVTSIVMISLYIIKTSWESYHDITSGRGFNVYILPFDTCSIFMWALFMAGFAKGKIKHLGECWLASGGLVGGISVILFLQALNYYPFFTFGAIYSMIWHFLMVFTGFLLLLRGYVKTELSTINYGYALQLIVSLVVIPLDYIFKWDFMLYRSAGGIPFIEGLASDLANKNLVWVTTVLMLGVYFVMFIVAVGIGYLTKKAFRISDKIDLKQIEVVAAIIERDGKIFCAQRNLEKSMGGKWEFPGGKIESGETQEEALIREIREELDSEVRVYKFLTTIEHDYPTFHITMHAYMCTLIDGELYLKEHNDSKWINKKELFTLDWAEADKPIVEMVMKKYKY